MDKWRKANEKENKVFDQFQANSIHWQTILEEAHNFYKNGAKWDGLEENCKRHREASIAWTAEKEAAGYRIGMRSLQVKVKPRNS